MLLKAFSIRDLKVGAYSPPFFQTTIGEAERTFHKLANSKDSTVGQYPEDYELFQVGEYDDQSALLTALAAPQHVIAASQVINR